MSDDRDEDDPTQKLDGLEYENAVLRQNDYIAGVAYGRQKCHNRTFFACCSFVYLLLIAIFVCFASDKGDYEFIPWLWIPLVITVLYWWLPRKWLQEPVSPTPPVYWTPNEIRVYKRMMKGDYQREKGEWDCADKDNFQILLLPAVKDWFRSLNLDEALSPFKDAEEPRIIIRPVFKHGAPGNREGFSFELHHKKMPSPALAGEGIYGNPL